MSLKKILLLVFLSQGYGIKQLLFFEQIFSFPISQEETIHNGIYKPQMQTRRFLESQKKHFRFYNYTGNRFLQSNSSNFNYSGLDPVTGYKINCINGSYNTTTQRCLCNSGYKSSGQINNGILQMCDQQMTSSDTPVDYSNQTQVQQLTQQFINSNTSTFLGLPLFSWILIGVFLFITIFIIAVCVIRKRRQKQKEKQHKKDSHNSCHSHRHHKSLKKYHSHHRRSHSN
ncbi:transmembrane protein, putative (macronuclear) [Tetrahymena thermophila SB210]|uniref:Transmembrane protein, putative n=1 Tax=Tetrahymena thermophila (strain SB210) TaxID=312017 RepID=Q24I29_TETTS|nr:transmembrane protein, putative [Tetrahymena thermophila SB210]EAS07409.2 transmembrane protein, putative [Tetrahymena thermophila SB210]|eukprot:XP_001027651.2 transmembrane protein, putative [Tetrahymena thermophila SB210]